MEENQLKANDANLFKKKSNKKIWWIVIGAVVIVAVIALIVASNKAKAASSLSYQTETVKKGELVAVVGATGTVRSNQMAYLTWQTTGRIDAINYKVGDKVAAGDVLATLAQDSLPQTVILASSDLIAAQESLDDLKNSTQSLANAELTLAQAQSAYNTALGNYWDRNETQGTENQITVYRTKLQIQDNLIIDLKNTYNSLSDLPNDNTDKNKALQNLTLAYIDRDNIKKTLDYYEAMPDNLDISTLKSKLDVAKANLDAAQRDYDKVKTGVNPDDVTAAQAKVTALQATVNMGSLSAPFAGTVTESDSLVGDLVIAGTNSFRVDDMNKLVVDVEVSEVDINSIKVGQTATLTFDAIANKEYSAKVTDVANVGDTIGGVVQFKVTLEILNPDKDVKPGMTAAVNITVTQLENVLTVPNRAVRTVNGQQVVYLLKNSAVVQEKVVLGAASDTNSEILSGNVKAGDQIILNPPSSFINLMQSQAQSQR